MLQKKTLFIQFRRFLGVGAVATLVHMLTFSLLMESVVISSVYANFMAFLVAFAVSFFGHFRWTFKEQTRNRVISDPSLEMARFFGTALIGLFLNTVSVWFVVDHLGAAYPWALFPMAVITPSVTFLLARFWAFSPKQASKTG